MQHQWPWPYWTDKQTVYEISVVCLSAFLFHGYIFGLVHIPIVFIYSSIRILSTQWKTSIEIRITLVEINNICSFHCKTTFWSWNWQLERPISVPLNSCSLPVFFTESHSPFINSIQFHMLTINLQKLFIKNNIVHELLLN